MNGNGAGTTPLADSEAQKGPDARLDWVKPSVQAENMKDALSGGSNWANLDGSSCGS